jgi:hypothetical protein
MNDEGGSLFVVPGWGGRIRNKGEGNIERSTFNTQH